MFPTRNPYATALFFVGFIFIKSKEFRKYFFTWLGACFIHVSSIIVFPIYWLHGLRLKFKYQTILYISTIVFAALFASLLQTIGASLSFGYGTIDEKLQHIRKLFEKKRVVEDTSVCLFLLCSFVCLSMYGNSQK